MKALCIVVLATAVAVAAAAVPPGGFWMKTYPLRSYSAIWTFQLSTKDFAKTRGAVEKVLIKRHGVSTVPPESQVGSEKVRYLQWSCSFSRAQASKALEDLKKLGTVVRATEMENFQPEHDGEIPVKRESLAGERAAASAVLQRFPAIAAAVAEINAHLDDVEKAWQESQDKVLLNLSLEESLK